MSDPLILSSALGNHGTKGYKMGAGPELKLRPAPECSFPARPPKVAGRLLPGEDVLSSGVNQIRYEEIRNVLKILPPGVQSADFSGFADHFPVPVNIRFDECVAWSQ